MECSFRYTRNNNLGIIELAGEKDFRQVMQIWERIRQFIRNDGLDGIIIVDRMTNALTEHHMFELGKWLGSSQFPRGVKVAIVDPGKMSQGNMNAFGETVLLNRGFYNIRVFPDHETAGTWLGIKRQAQTDSQKGVGLP
ncbi:MAG: hypothetical protein ACOX3E_03195 [Desulfomonilia bacterium]|jgi:hypothetical protein|uniref:STAS/SEC14 domain-containing protein n=1 Tax=anaerobic digester metagenome TaxID=1263854 RepID=A0A485LY69_9ZZZZ|nr:hypothetical protein [Pseudomonadota bacterium]HON38710.1 hypothetical protein [Deltaproteobacteria bacterium]HRS55835.1 hypothetical protein [Desulfomonilia bacterium]HPD20982.1 hypothetical protein [Deltaproteobacteria bacterium]HPX17486.1 hypothetical protein [Deltaproteobacteria bacterium]